MINPHFRTLRKSAHTATRHPSFSVTIRDLERERDLDDFFERVQQRQWRPKEIAAQAAERLIRPDEERSAMNVVVCVLIATFLDETYGLNPLDDDGAYQRRLKDLRDILTEKTDRYAMAIDWADAWYG